MQSRLQYLIKKYERFIEYIEWHIKTNNPPEIEMPKLNKQLDMYREFVFDLKSI